jgi:biotin synthase-related radical SAM superfamily protein
MDRISYKALEGVHAFLRPLFDPNFWDCPLLHISKTEEKLCGLRKTFVQVLDVFAAAKEKTPRDLELEALAKKNVEIIDAMLADLQKLEDTFVKINAGIHVPDSTHVKAGEEERLERVQERLARRQVVTVPSQGRPIRQASWKPGSL